MADASVSNGSPATWETNVPLPTFKYHPYPLVTESVVKSNTECVCCGKTRGFIYTGPVYAVKEYDQCICPWCIADGSAHERLEASFTDECGIGGGGMWHQVPQPVIEEVAYRTPGFSGWQQEQWWTHCGDAAQFIGIFGTVPTGILLPCIFAVGVWRNAATVLLSVLGLLGWVAVGLWIEAIASC